MHGWILLHGQLKLSFCPSSRMPPLEVGEETSIVLVALSPQAQLEQQETVTAMLKLIDAPSMTAFLKSLLGCAAPARGRSNTHGRWGIPGCCPVRSPHSLKWP